MQTAPAGRIALAGFALALAATPLTAQTPKKEHDVITREEITGHPDFKTAFEVVRALRPQFLRASRATNSMGGGAAGQPTGSTTDDPSGGSNPSQGILVVIDDVRSGRVDALRTVPVEPILEIRHLSASEAYGINGTDQAGVIIVKTGTPAKP